ncbi:MAG: hypothetical protein ACLFSQ_10530 [Candidatus Zixiibacteriota bacterium]
MRKRQILVFSLMLPLFLGTILAQGPPGLTALSDLDGYVPLSWEEPPPPLEDLVEIVYDDGESDGVESSGFNATVVQRFTPAEPCTLYGFTFKYYLTGTGPSRDYLNTKVYVFNDYLGGPDLDSIMAYEDTSFTPYFGFYEYYFDEPVYVEDDFHIGFKKTDTLLRSGTAFFNIHKDSESSGRAWILSGMYRDSIPGDLLLRAIVRYPSDGLLRRTPSGLAESSPWLDGKYAYTIEDDSSIYRPAESMAADAFKVYRWSDTTGIFREVAELDAVHSWIDSSVVNHHPYYYKVRGFFEGLGWTEFSDSVYAMPRGGPGMTIYDTLKLDSGTEIGGVRWHPRYRFAMRHHSPTNALLYKLLFHFDSDSGEYKPAIYAFEDTIPSMDEIFEWPFSVPAREGWNSQNIFSERIFVDGDFVVSCNITNASLAMSWAFPTEPNVAFDYNLGDGAWYSVSDTAYFIRAILKYSTDVWNVKLHRGWNLVSLPVIPETTATPPVLFPTMIGGSCFRYNPEASAYDSVGYADTLRPGYGYWVLSGSDTTYQITGRLPVYNYDLPVYRGWNMIGAAATYPNVPLEMAHQFPRGIMVEEDVYWYDPVERSYGYGTDKLSAGKGYWILINRDGTFRLDTRRLMKK